VPAPERRTRADVVVAAAIAVAVLVVAGLIWSNSQERGTLSRPAATALPQPATATAVPSALRELWHAPAAAESGPPIAVSGVVVTADGGAVVGRNPANGREVWRYQRNLALCGAQTAWGTVVAVYRDRRGCSQASELAAGTGARITARNSLADHSVTLSANDSYIVSHGSRRLELWRSDLVRTLEYGYVDAPVNPNSQPRSGCTLLGAAMNEAGGRLAVLEKCPGDSDDRLTLLNPSPKDAEKPEEYASSVLPDTTPNAPDPVLLATNGDQTALYLPGGSSGGPRIGIYDNNIKTTTAYPLPDPLTAGARVERIGFDYLLWTGGSTVALNAETLAPQWSLDDATGPGTLMAQHILVPTANGIAVLAADGHPERTIPVARHGYTGPIELAVIGDTVLEQRGDMLYALG
jgi:hypothetical protein